MAKVTNAFTTYQAQGNREDLSNAIYNIDPFDTPVMSACKRRNVKNRIFDWQTENLPTVAPAYPTAGYNAQFEGFQLSNSLAQPTIRQNNVTQISERDATVSGTQEEVDAAGKGSEMAHQMAITAKVLKSDMETALCSRQPRVTGDDTVPTARVTEGFAHWVARAATPRTGQAAGSGPAPWPASSPACRSPTPTPSPPSPQAARSRSRKPCSARRCRTPTPTAQVRPYGSCRRGLESGRSPHLHRQKHDAGLGGQD